MNILKYQMHLSFVAIAVGVILFYGIHDENADFFKKGKGMSNQYETVYHKHVYHFGVMVSDAAVIAVLTIIGCLIYTIVHVGIKEMIKYENR